MYISLAEGKSIIALLRDQIGSGTSQNPGAVVSRHVKKLLLGNRGAVRGTEPARYRSDMILTDLSPIGQAGRLKVRVSVPVKCMVLVST